MEDVDMEGLDALESSEGGLLHDTGERVDAAEASARLRALYEAVPRGQDHIGRVTPAS